MSASLLLLEIYWLRAFEEAEWGHLASMVVSTAMLGIGAGSMMILVGADSVRRHAGAWHSGLTSAQVLLAGLSPLAMRLVPFEPQLLLWRASPWGWLIVRELVVAIPLAAAGAVVTLALRCSIHPGSVYAMNLLGSAAGVALGLGLSAVRPVGDLHSAALGAAILAACGGHGGRLRAAILVVGLAWAMILRPFATPLPHPAKDLPAALRLPGARILDQHPGIAGQWTLVESPALHLAPGLSLLRTAGTPRVRAVFVHGDAAGAAFAAAGAGVLRHRVHWLPYAVRSPRSVLVLGNASILDLQAAHLAGAGRIVAVVPDAHTRRALLDGLGRFTGLSKAPLRLLGGSLRSALARLPDGDGFDLVVVSPDDSLQTASVGLGATLENHELSIEGLASALEITSPRGQVEVARWTQAPPRDLPRLVATFVRALRRLGIDAPRSHLALIRNWDAWVLLASRVPYDGDELRRLAAFAREHGFDRILPAAPIDDPVFHRLPGPDERLLVMDILDRDGAVPADGELFLEPATDDRPFFHHFLSPSRLPRWLITLRDGSVPPSEWGTLFLVAALASALVLGAILIAVPGFAASGPRSVLRGSGAATVLFTAIGFGYMFLEVLFFHVGTRLTGTPAAAAGVVLLAFLTGSGIGAAWCGRLGERGASGMIAASTAAVLALNVALWLGPGLSRADGFSNLGRWTALFGTSLLVAIPLGMPLPAGLSRYGERRIPWLLAVNGWASVVGAVLASAVALLSGFRMVAIAAGLLYLLAAAILARTPGASAARS